MIFLVSDDHHQKIFRDGHRRNGFSFTDLETSSTTVAIFTPATSSPLSHQATQPTSIPPEKLAFWNLCNAPQERVFALVDLHFLYLFESWCILCSVLCLVPTDIRETTKPNSDLLAKVALRLMISVNMHFRCCHLNPLFFLSFSSSFFLKEEAILF